MTTASVIALDKINEKLATYPGITNPDLSKRLPEEYREIEKFIKSERTWLQRNPDATEDEIQKRNFNEKLDNLVSINSSPVPNVIFASTSLLKSLDSRSIEIQTATTQLEIQREHDITQGQFMHSYNFCGVDIRIVEPNVNARKTYLMKVVAAIRGVDVNIMKELVKFEFYGGDRRIYFETKCRVIRNDTKIRTWHRPLLGTDQNIISFLKYKEGEVATAKMHGVDIEHLIWPSEISSLEIVFYDKDEKVVSSPASIKTSGTELQNLLYTSYFGALILSRMLKTKARAIEFIITE